MTSAEAVKKEIERFLRSPEPEVLCITGAWGVGKTYTWQSILDRVRAKRETGLSRYSYVSLTGFAPARIFQQTSHPRLCFQPTNGTERGSDSGQRTQFEQLSSGLPLKADVAQHSRHFAFVPIGDIAGLA